jgi:hypothetical protein
MRLQVVSITLDKNPENGTTVWVRARILDGEARGRTVERTFISRKLRQSKPAAVIPQVDQHMLELMTDGARNSLEPIAARLGSTVLFSHPTPVADVSTSPHRRRSRPSRVDVHRCSLSILGCASVDGMRTLPNQHRRAHGRGLLHYWF